MCNQMARAGNLTALCLLLCAGPILGCRGDDSNDLTSLSRVIQLSPSPLEFGCQSLGDATNAEASFVVSAYGGGTQGVEISAITSSRPGVVIDPTVTFPMTLAPGGQVVVKVILTVDDSTCPTFGPSEATLSVVSDVSMNALPVMWFCRVGSNVMNGRYQGSAQGCTDGGLGNLEFEVKCGSSTGPVVRTLAVSGSCTSQAGASICTCAEGVEESLGAVGPDDTLRFSCFGDGQGGVTSCDIQAVPQYTDPPSYDLFATVVNSQRDNACSAGTCTGVATRAD